MITATTLQLKRTTNVAETRKRFFYLAILVLGLCVCAYLYMVSLTVVNIIERRTAENNIKGFSSRLGTLELEYLSATKNIDLDMAKSLGFKEPSAIGFAGKAALSRAVSKNDL